MSMQLKTLLKRPAITAEEGASIGTAVEIMQRHGIRHLPVLRGHALVGMLTECDVRRAGPSEDDLLDLLSRRLDGELR
jgi:CBS domain-containing protein